MITKAKTKLNQLIPFLTNIYAPSPTEDDWSNINYIAPQQPYLSATDSRVFRWFSKVLRWIKPSSSLEDLLSVFNRVRVGLGQPILLPTPSTFILNTDFELDEITIVASKKTANALQPLLGDLYVIVSDEKHYDAIVSVSPELCQALVTNTESHSLSVRESHIESDFEWATREFSSKKNECYATDSVVESAWSSNSIW